MHKLLILLLAVLSGVVAAERPATSQALGQVVRNLAQISGKSVRPYSTRDFGREQFAGARSVIVSASEAEATLQKIRKVLPPGFVAFVGTTNSLARQKPEGVELVVGEGGNQFEILRIAASDAVNYSKTTEDIIAKLQQWDTAYGIDIWQAETDTIQLRFKKVPTDLGRFAKEVYEFCPDIVEQGTGSVGALEKEIKKTQSLFLWWD
jgi:hypothetical protein